MNPKNEGAILAQPSHATPRPPRLRWWIALASLPLLGVVGAFGISPQTVIEPIETQRVAARVVLNPAVVTAEEAESVRYWREERIQRGDTLGSLLSRLQVDDPDALRQIQESGARSLRQLVPGRPVKAIVDDNGLLHRLDYRIDNRQYTLERGPDGFEASESERMLDRHIVMKSGTIQTSLFGATDAAGVPDAIASQMAEVFSGDIDFYRDLRRGDRFSIMYEALEADGDFVRSGRIIAAEFVNQGRVLRAVYFEDDSGRGSYFTPDGRNMRRAFLRSPLEFSRVTSGFTTARFHPILQTWRAHKGIDYGAPVGTPVRATADATVGLAGRQNGYGNVIVLRHANGIQTLYAHLSGFRRDLRTGSRVQQGELIGYVGMTGMATGPHLHYEFHINGVHVDPLRSAPQPGPAITAQMRPAFQTIAREQVERLEQIRELNLAALE